VKSARWIVSYILAASVGLWFALFLSLKFIAPARAQQPPAAAQMPPPPGTGELPPEFAQGAAAAVPATPPAAGTIPPPPTEPPPDLNAPPASAPAVPAQMPMPPSATDQIPPMDAAPAPVMPQFAEDEQYHYESAARRDPFKPYKNYRPPTVQGKIDSSDPLQRWDLGRFVIVAIMWEVRSPRAMVKDPDGKLYMINKTTKIGRNSGQVVAIREGEVVVVESIENEGVVTKEVKILELKK
jgi:type IV pilus assembly protein PilP